MSRPLATLADAIARAQEKRLPVIACAEPYVESLRLVDGVTMYGYFDCSKPEWTREKKRAVVASPKSPAVLAEDLTIPARFEGFEIHAPDIVGAAPGNESSYGMILRRTKNLAMGELSISAGNAQDGVDGAEPSEVNAELSAEIRGGGAYQQEQCVPSRLLVCTGVRVPGAHGGSSKCKFGPNGGPGGVGGMGPISSNGAVRETISVADATGGGGSAVTAAGGAPLGLAGGVGTAGSDGAPGSIGTIGTGRFAEEGYVAGTGGPGGMGSPGQGGGGGAGTTKFYIQGGSRPTPPPSGIHYGASGAGGGAGGCGGVPGSAGTGGGASVGLFVVDSDGISLSNTKIVSRAGGRAGKGATGTEGTFGGAGGPGEHLGQIDARPPGLYASAGGRGGAGGAGGLAGHGAPGPSVALVFTGARPVFKEGVELVWGTPGAGTSTTRGAQTLTVADAETNPEHAF